MIFGTSGISMMFNQYILNFHTNPGTTAYQKLRYVSNYANANTGSITLGGLIIGHKYQVQVWAPQWNQPFQDLIGGVAVNTGNSAATPAATAPQYVVGTFAATAASQPILWNAGSGGNSLVPAAVSLRDVTAAVSSYTTWAAAQTPPLSGGPGAVGHDGLSNLLVYGLALKTNGGNGSPATLTGNALTFTKRSAAVTNNDVTYSIQTSADLGISSTWTTTTTTGVVDNPTSFSYTLPTGQGKIFARLVVTQK